MKWPVVAGVALSAVLLGGTLVWVTVRQDREFQRLIAAGDAALAADETSTAIEAFSGAVALQPDAMLPYLKRGDTYRRRGELPAALRDLREAVRLEPGAPRPLELLGDVNVAMGRYDRAVEEYRRFLALDDRAPRTLYKLALTQYRRGAAADAIEPLRQAIAIDARMAEAHYLLGLCLREQQRREAALQSLTRAVDLNPALAPAREALADLYAATGNDRDRLEQLEALAALEPARPERLVSVARAYAELGRMDAALVTLARGTERFPDEPAVHLALGRFWLDNGGPADAAGTKRALEALRPVVERAGAPGDALALYGRALLRTGDARGAQRMLQQAVARPPVDPSAYRDLAVASRRVGDAETARLADTRFAALAAR